MRATHAPARDAPDAQVRQYVQVMKWGLQARRNAANMGGRPQPVPQPMPAPVAQQAGVPVVAPQAFPPGQPNPAAASMPEHQTSARPIAQPNKPSRPHQQAKPVSQNPSPAGAIKNLKRPMENETENSLQPPANGARPGPGTGQLNMDPNSLSEAQLATLTPEQRQKLELRKQFLGHLARIMAEEKQNFDPSIYPEVPFGDHPQNPVKVQFVKIAQGFRQMSNQAIIGRWFMAFRDEERLRSFFKTVS